MAALLVALYALQATLPGLDRIADGLGFAPADLAAGRWTGLVSALFVHASWSHVLFNAVFALAFGTAVARVLGSDARGAAAFFAVFLICGVLGNLACAAARPGGAEAVVGASGGVAGLMGGASRLMDRRGLLLPFTHPTVIAMAAVWVGLNVVVGVLGVSAGPGPAGAGLAWEAHVAGYAAGLLLLSPAATLLGRRPPPSGPPYGCSR